MSITVNITKDNVPIKDIVNVPQSDSLVALIASLNAVKAETNNFLSELVELDREQGSSKEQVKEDVAIVSTEEDDGEGSTPAEGTPQKKPKAS